MTAVVVSSLLLALGAIFYALGLVPSIGESCKAELRVTLELLREGTWSSTEALIVATRGSLSERGATRWLDVRGCTLFRLACETFSAQEVGPDKARIRCELEARTSDGETRTSMQFLWPGRGGSATSRDAELLLKRIAAELC